MTVAVANYESSAVFSQIHQGLSSSQPAREAAIKKVNAVFQFDVKNKEVQT
jgi:hypothetical protein